MGQTIMGRPVSQRFDPSFSSTSFPTLHTASSPFAPNPQQFAGFTMPQQPQVPVSTIPKQIVPRTIGTGPSMGPNGFRGVTNPMRKVNA